MVRGREKDSDITRKLVVIPLTLSDSTQEPPYYALIVTQSTAKRLVNLYNSSINSRYEMEYMFCSRGARTTNFANEFLNLKKI